ncbi:Protein disulfide isomerase pTAC5, chloroplastic [Trifolium repens]|nr:Protein disulfide isomerase pTAC5, chloroplastic [Trifolium repens]
MEKDCGYRQSVLRTGSKGEAVRELQEALQKMGFYSGEEDMEFSSFSSGTERVVKTWQVSLCVAEDGIMTSELLKKLYLEKRTADIGNANETKKSTTVCVVQK